MNIFRKITLRTLKQNKSRTMVTIIGVILSTAMITAITVFLSSLTDYAVKSVEAQEGGWHTLISTVDAKEAASLSENEETASVVSIENTGWAMVPELESPSIPYLYIAGFTEEAFSSLPVELTEGRLPQNSHELVLPNHFTANLEGRTYKVGDTITLELGRRMLGDEELCQQNPYMDGTDGPSETLEDVYGKLSDHRLLPACVCA